MGSDEHMALLLQKEKKMMYVNPKTSLQARTNLMGQF